jgi:hypothetical protein
MRFKRISVALVNLQLICGLYFTNETIYLLFLKAGWNYFFHLSNVRVSQNALPVTVIANLVHIPPLCLTTVCYFLHRGQKRPLY